MNPLPSPERHKELTLGKRESTCVRRRQRRVGETSTPHRISRRKGRIAVEQVRRCGEVDSEAGNEKGTNQVRKNSRGTSAINTVPRGEQRRENACDGGAFVILSARARRCRCATGWSGASAGSRSGHGLVNQALHGSRIRRRRGVLLIHSRRQFRDGVTLRVRPRVGPGASRGGCLPRARGHLASTLDRRSVGKEEL